MAGPLTENDRLPAKAERIAVPDSETPQESGWTDPAAWMLAIGALVLAVMAWAILRAWRRTR